MAKKKITADKILQAAEEEFLAKGFSGTSINDIGNKASIHKSLIYHYFKNKEDLWKAVKIRILSSYSDKNPVGDEFYRGTFKEFLTEFVQHRFDFYDQNPTIARLIAWQRLEGEREALETKMTSLLAQIVEFQRLGRIRSDIEPEMIEYMMMNLSSLPFMAKSKLFEGKESKKNKEIYVNWVVHSLLLKLESP